MILQLLSLEWKQFIRSKAFKQNLVVKILIGFFALYMLFTFLALGALGFFALEDTYPDKDPLTIVNNFLIYWFLLDLIYRFFMQNLPVMNVKPLMLLPINRKKIIHYLLLKSSLSFFNFLPLLFFLPFSIVLLVKGYPPLQVINWFLAIGCIELCINFINYLINKQNGIFYGALGLFVLFGVLEYYNIYKITTDAGVVFNWIYETAYAFLLAAVILILLYRRLFSFLIKGFYLDGYVEKEKNDVKEYKLSWLDRFGNISVFLKNDIRMILRNKRPKQVVLTSFLFLFYGLIFYANSNYADNYNWLLFGALFVTGGFLMTFGQLVPSWDSEYYKMLMSQNIPYKKYLESKWYLMIIGTLVSFILSTPYLYFGWKAYSLIVGVAFFNVGLNSFITLWSGAVNRNPIELNVKAKAFSNTKGFNVTQLLWSLPKLVLPIFLFFIPNLLFDFTAGILTLVISGIIGLIFKNFFLSQIEKVYQKGKYKTIAAFSEKS